MQHGSVYAHCLTAFGFRVKPGMTVIRDFLNDYNGFDLHPGKKYFNKFDVPNYSGT
jgi:hypothetical protein